MPQEQKLLTADDEIDLRELLQAFWRGRFLIMASMLAAVCIASIYLHSTDRKYTITYTFQPVTEENEGIQLKGLSGIASLAGLALPTGGSGDFQTFRLLLQAEEVAKKLINRQAIMRQVFANEWNDQRKQFEQPEVSAKDQAITAIKTLLTGEERKSYIPPDAARLASWISEAFEISMDRATGFLELKSETSNPELILKVMTSATTTTDRIIKDRFLASGRQSIKFYQNKIVAARSRESREALAQLIVREQRKLMLASNGNYFTARPLTAPSVSLYPTSPKSSLVLALAMVLGGFFGAAIVLISKANKND